MDARKHLIIIKGKDQTDSVASFQFHDGKCEVVYTSAPNKTYSFQSSNVEILPLKKKIDPAQVIVTANGQTISEIDELLDFGGYDCFYTSPELSAQKQEIEECHRALSEALGKLERRLVLWIIDAKDRIAEDTSIDSFITGFELAWKLSMELNYYENERSVFCRTAMELRARFTSKEEEK